MTSRWIFRFVQTAIRGHRPRVVTACGLLLVLSAAPLYAQFTLTDLYDFNCATGGCYPEQVGPLVRGKMAICTARHILPEPLDKALSFA